MSTHNPYRVKKEGILFEEHPPTEGRISIKDPKNAVIETNEKFLRWFHKQAQYLMMPIVYNLLCQEFENLNPTVKLKRL